MEQGIFSGSQSRPKIAVVQSRDYSKGLQKETQQNKNKELLGGYSITTLLLLFRVGRLGSYFKTNNQEIKDDQNKMMISKIQESRPRQTYSNK